MACSDSFEWRFQLGEWLYAVGLAAFDRRGDAAPGVTAFIMVGEPRVLVIEGGRANRIFNMA